MPLTTLHIPALAISAVLVPRDQLRRKTPGRTLRMPGQLGAAVPAPPAACDWSKNRTIQYPILGNDQFGDCYLCDALHCVQTWTGNNGPPAQFDRAAVVSLYLQLSRGDNGLSDSEIFPAWKRGLFGHKILDEMTVDPRDDAAIRLGLWAFGGGSYTASLLDTWQRNIHDGATWDAGGRPDPMAGHAMHLSGYTPAAYQDETWGLRVNLTPAGLKASDPEVTVQFSAEWFNAKGYAPNGLHYTELAALWQQLGGGALPPSPFPAPEPPTPAAAAPPPAPGAAMLKTLGLSLAFDGWTNGENVGSIAQVKGTAKVTGVSGPALPPAPAALVAHINGKAIIADVGALFLAYATGNVVALIAAAEKLLADLGVKDPTPND
jgi:hypothetical protein